jgi:hypothetical protein
MNGILDFLRTQEKREVLSTQGVGFGDRSALGLGNEVLEAGKEKRIYPPSHIPECPDG